MLSCNNAIGAIPRLIDMGVEPFLLSSTLNFVMAQRLARKICDHCKTKITLPPNMEDSIKKETERIDKEFMPDVTLTTPLTFWKGKGCTRCGNTGYKGRIAVAEIIDVNDEIKELINKGASRSEEMEKLLEKQSFITIRQDSIIKALRGFTTMDEVFRISQL